MDTTTGAKGSLASQALADNTNPRLPNPATGDANVRVGALALLGQTAAAIFVILGQEQKPRPKARRWADSIQRDFGHDPLLDHRGKRMKWTRRLAPKGSLASQALADNTNPRLPNPATGDANVRVGALAQLQSEGARSTRNDLNTVFQ